MAITWTVSYKRSVLSTWDGAFAAELPWKEKQMMLILCKVAVQKLNRSDLRMSRSVLSHPIYQGHCVQKLYSTVHVIYHVLISQNNLCAEKQNLLRNP